jgi:hypothetical protein
MQPAVSVLDAVNCVCVLADTAGKMSMPYGGQWPGQIGITGADGGPPRRAETSCEHQLRHSALTHDAEDGASAPLLMTKSGQSSTRSLVKYARPALRRWPRGNRGQTVPVEGGTNARRSRGQESRPAQGSLRTAAPR